MVVVAIVDLVSGPSEDAELVMGSEVGKGEGDGSGSTKVVRGGVEEEVADEILVGGARWRVDAKPVEIGGGVDAGPPDLDGVVGFG